MKLSNFCFKGFNPDGSFLLGVVDVTTRSGFLYLKSTTMTRMIACTRREDWFFVDDGKKVPKGKMARLKLHV